MTYRPQAIVVGGGNIGSRHVQGLARSALALDIVVVEPHPQARSLTQARFDEVPRCSDVSLSFRENLTELAGTADVAVIATQASVRRAVVEALLAQIPVRSMVLEKVLFQRIADYAAVGRLLREREVAAFVNCPRRLWPGYQALRERLSDARPVSLRVAMTGQVGLGSNAIHLLDTFVYLGGDPDLSLDGSRLTLEDRTIRREGACEFSGVLLGFGRDGGQFEASYRPSSEAPLLVDVTTPDHRLIIREAEQRAFLAEAAGEWRWEEIDFPTWYQSELTGVVADELIAGGTCALTPFDASARIHIPLLDALLEAQNRQRGEASDICAIT